jgi:hypothetical protein
VPFHGTWSRRRLKDAVVFAESVFAERIGYEHPECIGHRRQLTGDHLKRIRRRIQIRRREAVVVSLMDKQAVSSLVERLGDVSLSLRDRDEAILEDSHGLGRFPKRIRILAHLEILPTGKDYRYGRWCTCPLRPREDGIVVGETDPCTRSTESAARSLAWSISPSGAVEPNTVYVITPLCKTSSTTSHAPGKRPWTLTPGFGTADTHRISDESGVTNTRQTFGSRDTRTASPRRRRGMYLTRPRLSLPELPDAVSRSGHPSTPYALGRAAGVPYAGSSVGEQLWAYRSFALGADSREVSVFSRLANERSSWSRLGPGPSQTGDSVPMRNR